MSDRFDCVVMGAGPAGCTVATLLAKAGRRTLLVEREKMPRFHIGESLMPEAYWVFERLGLLEKMKKSPFVKKVSVQFVSNTGRESSPFDFRLHDPRECSVTWQVERAPFDQMMFEHAAQCGADCRDQTRVIDVLVDPPADPQAALCDGRVRGVRLQRPDGSEEEIAAKVVVDATGLQGILSHKFNLRMPIPHLRKSAVWGYYEHARRDPGDLGGGTIILHTREKRSWFWFIPISPTVTSIGVVGNSDYLLRRVRNKPSEIFEDELVLCAPLAERLIDARLVSEFRVAREFSVLTRQHAGEGWVLVGDAFAFIDPIYSSGVYFALKSGELAADAIAEGLAKNDVSAAQLGRWCEEYKAGTRWILKLVEAYYNDQFSFGEFMRAFPQHKGNLTDLLIGRIFHDQAGRIFSDMQPWLDRASPSLPAGT